MVDASSFIEEAVAEIKDEIGDGRAVMALSGGVDSSVCATLAYEAVGDRVTPVYVDTGLMRKGETETVRETFDYMDSLRVVDARDRFVGALEGVIDPEEKRRVVGENFIRVFEEVVDNDFRERQLRRVRLVSLTALVVSRPCTLLDRLLCIVELHLLSPRSITGVGIVTPDVAV